MQIQFKVADTIVEFRRNWLTGRADLSVGGQVVPLQNPFDPRTHFSFSLKRSWQYRVADHEVVVEKLRPLFLAGWRPQAYRVLLDGRVVAEKTGY